MPKVVSTIAMWRFCRVFGVETWEPSLCDLTPVRVEFESTYLCTFSLYSSINRNDC